MARRRRAKPGGKEQARWTRKSRRVEAKISRRPCPVQGKKRFTRADARRTADRAEGDDGVKRYTYKCPHCDCYHITRMAQGPGRVR